MTLRTQSRIKARGLCSGYAGHQVLKNLNVDIPADQVTAIIGPNGCGKSTLLRTMSHLLPIKSGSVTIDGVSIERLKRKQLSLKLAVLPQSPIAPEGLIVSDLVARGRHPHQTWLKQWSSDDEEKVADALNLTGAKAFAERTLDSLSGGQRQRVWISMVLAQDTPVVFLDEPTTYLDQSHSIEILDLVHRLTREAGKTIVMVLHDLNMALRYADHLVIMEAGRVAAAGAPGDIISSEILGDVFRLNAIVIEDPVTGGPLIVPKAPAHIRAALEAKADMDEANRESEKAKSAAKLKAAAQATAKKAAAKATKAAAPVVLEEPVDEEKDEFSVESQLEAASLVAREKAALADELSSQNKKASIKARKLRAKATKFDSVLEEIDPADPDRDRLIDTAHKAAEEAEVAEDVAEDIAEELGKAKAAAAQAEEQLVFLQNQVREDEEEQEEQDDAAEDLEEDEPQGADFDADTPAESESDVADDDDHPTDEGEKKVD